MRTSDRTNGRVSRFGNGHFYTVLARGQVVHVSWLLPCAAMEKDPPEGGKGAGVRSRDHVLRDPARIPRPGNLRAFVTQNCALDG